MNDGLEDLCYKYKLKYPTVFDQYVYLEHRLLRREHGVIKGYLFVDRSKYQDKIISVLNRYYRRQASKIISSASYVKQRVPLII